MAATRPEPRPLRRPPEWARRLGASLLKPMTASWSGPRKGPTEYKVAARCFACHGRLPSVRLLPDAHISDGIRNRNDVAGMISRCQRQASQISCHGAQARPMVGAHHAHPAREERARLRMAALPPRKKASGALATPSAPCRSNGVGTRGVPPPQRNALAARRRTRGLIWNSPLRIPNLRLILRNTKVSLDTESPIQGSGRSRNS